MILLYSDPDYDPNKEDKAQLSNLRPEYERETLKKPSGSTFDHVYPGVKTDFEAAKVSQPRQKKTKSTKLEDSKGYYDNLEFLESKGILPFNLRNHRIKLVELLKKVQEYGVNHNLHRKKKYIFSGSWMESIDDLTDLMADMVQ